MVKLGIKILTPILIIILLFINFNSIIINTALRNQCDHPRLISKFYEVTFYKNAYNLNQCPDCGLTNQVIYNKRRPLPIQFTNFTFSSDLVLKTKISFKIINHTEKDINEICYMLIFCTEEELCTNSHPTYHWTTTGKLYANSITSCAFGNLLKIPIENFSTITIKISNITITFSDDTQLVLSPQYYDLTQIVC